MYMMNDLFNKFSTQNWSNLFANDKLSLLQSLENQMADIQGRDARTIVPFHNEDGILGVYSKDDPKHLYLNEDFFYSYSSGIQYEAMNTVFHEGRHAYQDDCVNGKIHSNESNEKLNSWGRNFDVYNDPQEVAFYEYRFQPIEDDANNYANSMMESLRDTSLINDQAYKEYIVSMRHNNYKNEQIARENLGDDFRREIADQINHDYEQKHFYDKNPVLNEKVGDEISRGSLPQFDEQNNSSNDVESSKLRGTGPEEVNESFSEDSSSNVNNRDNGEGVSRGEVPEEKAQNDMGNEDISSKQRGVTPDEAQSNPPKTPTNAEDNNNDFTQNQHEKERGDTEKQSSNLNSAEDNIGKSSAVQMGM